jgi:trehalose/maltose transport system substrate-binding protein
MASSTRHPGMAPRAWISAGASRTLATILFAMTLAGCRQSAREPVTLSYFRLGWSQPDELPTANPLEQQFTQKTGIRLKNLPVPETTLDQLDLSRRLLESGSGPDVLGIDLIWSGVLEGDLIDLRPYLASEISSLAPQLLPSYTVEGKLVAIPYSVQIGVLEYRTDLLREYGYDHPPKTWDELEKMAVRIQAGERAKGKKDFWGYVWQGADAEALTCNALEWQVAEGGGRIIENDRTISVNNPAAIRAWQRAKHWIGWISPPSVVAYRELDTINVFDSGRAAFDRVWGGTTITRRGLSRQIHWRSSLPVGKTGYTSIPSGPGERAGTLGGSGLAVSRRSVHPQEAIELVRFLIRAQIQSSEEEESSYASQPEVHDRSSVSDANNHFGKSIGQGSGVVSRPSDVAGSTYERVTRAYIGAVHSVLTGQRGAPEAAAELEKQLIEITGFVTGPPKTAE